MKNPNHNSPLPSSGNTSRNSGSQTSDNSAQNMQTHDISGLEQFWYILNHLTDFSRLLARRAPCSGLIGHNWGPTTSSGREKPAGGGPYLPTGLRCASCPMLWHRPAQRALPDEQI